MQILTLNIHTYTNTHLHTHTHRERETDTDTDTHTHNHTHTHTHTHKNIYIYHHMDVCSHTHIRARALACTYTHTHTHTHTHSHSLTHNDVAAIVYHYTLLFSLLKFRGFTFNVLLVQFHPRGEASEIIARSHFSSKNDSMLCLHSRWPHWSYFQFSSSMISHGDEYCWIFCTCGGYRL